MADASASSSQQPAQTSAGLAPNLPSFGVLTRAVNNSTFSNALYEIMNYISKLNQSKAKKIRRQLRRVISTGSFVTAQDKSINVKFGDQTLLTVRHPKYKPTGEIGTSILFFIDHFVALKVKRFIKSFSNAIDSFKPSHATGAAITLDISTSHLDSLQTKEEFHAEEIRVYNMISKLELSTDQVSTANALALYYEYRLRQRYILLRRRAARSFTPGKASTEIAKAFERSWMENNIETIPNRAERLTLAKEERKKFLQRTRKRLSRGKALFEFCRSINEAKILYLTGKIFFI